MRFSIDTHPYLYNSLCKSSGALVNFDSINYTRFESLFKTCVRNTTFQIAKAGVIFRNLLLLFCAEKTEKLGINISSPEYDKTLEFFALYLESHPLDENEFETVFKSLHSLIKSGFTENEP